VTLDDESNTKPVWQYRYENRPFQPILTLYRNRIPKGFISASASELEYLITLLTPNINELRDDANSDDARGDGSG
jgi:hypothetical protein